MVEVRSYRLPPTKLVPNSPRPLLHYPGLLQRETPADIHNLLKSNGWQTQWVFRYGATQDSHYHSAAHEAMVVLSGTAIVRFGVADTVADLEQNTHGDGKEPGGIEIKANTGDVFVLPAGLAHKTFDTSPSESFRLLTPGEAKGIAAEDVGKALNEIQLSGFTMLGAYPQGSKWDFKRSAEDHGQFEKSWSVPRPARDPVLGDAVEGICGQWNDASVFKGRL
ncbi:unnamed protein product [Zymoseptoria tritici ST99CH_1A5]|uniref:Cupin type-1 domain-containing protein n=3 Tax=Zymoseptoria tritici TaxID=1047171 RepID=A0A1X7RZR6_ZYMT9|nr:unnamed protein product [Zymoseptoria tritici ST99CH_3D7]SMR55510.1 unnamed protein product [Zymoseptoria tritici ST99CH_1E4]SMR57886.1 unnamed protein product [Zymoseptoria tritici ST99CH_3D1]SMY26321.1 unnamed protein product [Zymoseptoria tritici ST99CH_1A5]